MSELQPIRYARTGGRPPSDDERLEVDADGTWRLWRTMGGSRVGAFAGRLDPGRRRRLGAALESIRQGARSQEPRVPDSASESFHAGSLSLHVASGDAVSGEWARLVRLIRRWSSSFTTEPEAALELIPGSGGPDGAEPPRLERLGSGELRVYPDTLHVEAFARGADEVITDRVVAGEGRAGSNRRGDGEPTDAGWSLPLELSRRLDAPPGGRLEWWVFIDVDGGSGPVRARLIAKRTESPASASG
jgi:hypothetical protein